MTEQRMQEIATEIVNDLQPSQAGIFATVLKAAIENAPYSHEQMEMIDTELLSAGVDVDAVCRKRHPVP